MMENTHQVKEKKKADHFLAFHCTCSWQGAVQGRGKVRERGAGQSARHSSPLSMETNLWMCSAAFAVTSPAYATNCLLISSLIDPCLVNRSSRGRKSRAAVYRLYHPRESWHLGRPRLTAPLTIMLYSLGKRGALGQRAKQVIEKPIPLSESHQLFTAWTRIMATLAELSHFTHSVSGEPSNKPYHRFNSNRYNPIKSLGSDERATS